MCSPFAHTWRSEACSSDSSEGFCDSADFTCKPINTCRTCSGFTSSGGFCSEIDIFPNATIAEYGVVKGEDDMMAEIFARGPIACYINSSPLHEYQGGVYRSNNPADDDHTNHVISVVGWGVDEAGVKFWNVRNSWGEYWGELVRRRDLLWVHPVRDKR